MLEEGWGMCQGGGSWSQAFRSEVLAFSRVLAVLLLVGSGLAAALALVLLHGLKADVSAGSVNSPTRPKFPEKRVQVWVKALILYLLADCVELHGVASLPASLREECEESSSPPESSALTGLWVLRWPVRAPGSRTWSAHSSSGQGEQDNLYSGLISVGIWLPEAPAASAETTSGVFSSPHSEISHSLHQLERRRWSQAEGLTHRAVEGPGSFAAEREASICVTNIVICLLFSEREH